MVSISAIPKELRPKPLACSQLLTAKSKKLPSMRLKTQARWVR